MTIISDKVTYFNPDMCFILIFFFLFLQKAETFPRCPHCGHRLYRHGHRIRQLKHEVDAKPELLCVQRWRCPHCHKVHQEMPLEVIPYKRYAATCIEGVVFAPEDADDLEFEESTCRRWKTWFEDYFEKLSTHILNRMEKEHVPESILSVPYDIKSEDKPHWLAAAIQAGIMTTIPLSTRSAVQFLA